jgi:hypothetical protein
VRRDFIRTVQRKVAISAIPASALRGQRYPGLTRLVRDFLSALPLKQFGVAGPKLFVHRLDGATNQLLSTLPRQVRHWGVARKAVNLFLRDSFYNAYLRDRFALQAAELLYEVPLDEVVATGLARIVPRDLPRWPGVKYLTPKLSQIYQQATAIQAERMGMARVHLDIYLWTDRPHSA